VTDPLTGGLLDRATLDALERDLVACAHVLDVLVKGAPTLRADPEPVSLAEAFAALRGGHVRAVQVRYAYDGAEWRDTLVATPGGVRLVRARTETVNG
jgi:hypothetical protein